MNKRIFLSVASILIALSLMGGATYAYFSDTENSTGNTLGAGTLSINILDQNENTGFINETLASNWKPGDQTFVNFDVLNSGSLPVNLRGFATGTWGDSSLDSENRVKVIKVERWDGSAWDELTSNTSGITGLFYDTDNGASGGTAFVVNPSARAQFRLTVEFDPNAGNNFQGKSFTSSISVEAKQTNAPWL